MSPLGKLSIDVSTLQYCMIHLSKVFIDELFELFSSHSVFYPILHNLEDFLCKVDGENSWFKEDLMTQILHTIFDLAHHLGPQVICNRTRLNQGLDHHHSE